MFLRSNNDISFSCRIFVILNNELVFREPLTRRASTICGGQSNLSSISSTFSRIVTFVFNLCEQQLDGQILIHILSSRTTTSTERHFTKMSWNSARKKFLDPTLNILRILIQKLELFPRRILPVNIRILPYMDPWKLKLLSFWGYCRSKNKTSSA